jgi:hypothetical protein
MRMKQGDLFPFEYTLMYDDGTPIDLGVGTVKIYMTLDDAESPTVDGEDCAVITPASGIIRYQWTDPETSIPGMYRIEFVITFNGGSTLTVPSNDVIWMFIVPSLSYVAPVTP